MLEIILAIILGITFGTITGLIPGIHTNLVAVLLLSSSLFLLNFFSPISLILFIVAMSLTHTFVDFIPSIYLGAPDEDTVLSVMPGHKFLLKGKAHEAVLLTLIGSASAILLLFIIVPIFSLLIPALDGFIQQMMSFFLIWISIFLISKEKHSVIWAIIIFLLSGFLGLSVLNLNMSQPLLPLLTGLFGTSTIIYSISTRTKIPEQKISKLKIKIKDLYKPLLATTIVSPICSFLPGLGSAQAAIIGSQIVKKIKTKQFLILLGSINTLVLAVSFFTLYLIDKKRTGAASAISQIMQLTQPVLIYIFITIVITAMIASFLTINLSKLFARIIHKINYTKISFIVLFLLIIITTLISGFLGLYILTVSTILGLTCIYAGIRRGFLMGALLIPTILYYLPFF